MRRRGNTDEMIDRMRFGGGGGGGILKSYIPHTQHNLDLNNR